MPRVTMTCLRRARATAFETTLRNALGFATIWSLEKKPTTGSASLAARPTPSATAAPVSRRIGSPKMLHFGISGSSLLVAATRFFAVTTKTSLDETRPSRRLTAWRIRLAPPNTRKNCFGRSGVESGQNRSPEPPARMTALNDIDDLPLFIVLPHDYEEFHLESITLPSASGSPRADRIPSASAGTEIFIGSPSRDMLLVISTQIRGPLSAKVLRSAMETTCCPDMRTSAKPPSKTRRYKSPSFSNPHCSRRSSSRTTGEIRATTASSTTSQKHQFTFRRQSMVTSVNFCSACAGETKKAPNL